MRISDWSSDVCSSDLPERSQYVIAFELDQVAEQRRRGRNDFETRAHQRAQIVEAQALHGTRRAKRIRIAARLGVGDRLAHLAQVKGDHLAAIETAPGKGFVLEPIDRRLRRDPAALKRSADHTTELQSLMRISYAAFHLKKK